MTHETANPRDEAIIRDAIERALGPRPTAGRIRDLANLLLVLVDELEQRATMVQRSQRSVEEEFR